MKIYERFIKRPFDCICAVCASIVLGPILILVAIAVRVKLGPSIFFLQERVGKDGKAFIIYKFRTMTDERDAQGELLPDEVRLTKFGKALRATSLDELPELINIIKGDMAIVGPRPLLVKYLPYYTEEQRHRHDVRPGLTGYAQVHGRNAVNWDDRFSMDVNYVSRITFLGDMKILLETVGKVFKREGISSNTSVTMEDFCDYCESVGRTTVNQK